MISNSVQIIRDFRDLRPIVQELGSTQQDITEAAFPARPVVYGLCIKEERVLASIQLLPADFLYIGKSKKFSRRGHAKTGHTGKSTLRHTFGALLKQDLNLRAYSRGRGLNDKDHTNYRFNNAGEKRLSEWMNANLTIGFSAVTDDIDEIEQRLIRFCEPILNLKHWSNPSCRNIKALRKICAEEARRNGPLRDN